MVDSRIELCTFQMSFLISLTESKSTVSIWKKICAPPKSHYLQPLIYVSTCFLVFFWFKYFKNVYVILTMYFIFFYCTLKIKYHNTFNIVNEFYYSIFRRFFYHSKWRNLLHWWKLKYTTKGGRQ